LAGSGDRILGGDNDEEEDDDSSRQELEESKA
jgi:hypothetical protein